MNSLIVCLAALMLLIDSPAVAQDDARTKLEFELRTVTKTEMLEGTDAKITSEPPTPSSESNTRVRVSIHSDSIAWLDLESNEETLLDRKREQLIFFDHVAKQVRVTSFLAWIAALDQEKHHRLRLAQTIQRAGVTETAFETFWLESLFRSGREAADTVTISEQDGEQEFSYDSEPVLSVTPGTTEIPDALRNSWKLFLIRTLPVHSAIRDRLAALDSLPRQIRYRYYNIGRRTDRVLRFGPWPSDGEATPAAAATDRMAARSSYSIRVDPENALDVLLANIATKRLAVETISRQEYTERVQRAAEAGSHLDAFLILLEGSFAYPDLPVQEMAAAIDMRGPEVKPLLQIMQLVNADPAAANKALLALPRDGLQGAATLDVLRANALIALKKPREAEALFLRVLRSRPWLAGPFKDLGDLYATQFAMPKAWRCWQRAYDLAPQHPLLRGFVGLQKDLRARYAEWLGP